MKVVGSGLGEDVDLTSGGPAELGAVTAGQGLGLGDCLRHHDDQTDLAIASVLRVVQAVEVPLGALGSSEGELRGSEGRAWEADHSRREQEEVVDVARGDGEVLHLLAVEHRSDGRGSGVEHRRSGVHCYDLAR